MSMKTRILPILTPIILLLPLLLVAGNQPLRAGPYPQIDGSVLEAVEQGGQADVLILLGNQPDLSPAYALQSKEARGRWVYDTLGAAAQTDQTELLAELERSGVAYQRFWAVNAVRATINADSLQRIRSVSSVKRIQSDLWGRGIDPQPLDPVASSSIEPTSWGVERVQAPWVWEQGYTGEGVVVAGQDTGYDWDHPALKQSFRGFDSVTDTADFNYNWHDAIHEDLSGNGSNPCGYDSPVPCDDHGHGTHTMGTMVGNDLDPESPDWPAGAENVVGVAPGATWMSCRNMEQGFGRPSTYIECFEWLTAPYPLGGDPLTDGEPGKAPDVINNSWSCPPAEDCTTELLEIIEPAVNAADAAGIVVVVSAGNGGSAGCQSIVSPPAIYPRSFSVGNTTSTDSLANSSSRGWVTYKDETSIKPHIAAPGTAIHSSIPGTGYASFSGTSMASPHVAAVIALLLDAAPELRGDTDFIKAVVSQTAEPVTDFVCGGDPSGSPNNRFGWGIINARRAIESLSQPGFLVGHVTDTRGVAVAGVTITAYDLDGNVEGITVTDAVGSYSLPLDWGKYNIEVTAGSFEPDMFTPTIVVGGQSTELDVTIEHRILHMPLILQ
ncbi:MAG: S8 family serine peptidase [Chloroflexi bacterium]|nr:S8 family serine peptidase [Chloroflexota bacterium]